jgi:hypothetical protein
MEEVALILLDLGKKNTATTTTTTAATTTTTATTATTTTTVTTVATVTTTTTVTTVATVATVTTVTTATVKSADATAKAIEDKRLILINQIFELLKNHSHQSIPESAAIRIEECLFLRKGLRTNFNQIDFEAHLDTSTLKDRLIEMTKNALKKRKRK